ncbi:MAG: hypothetical protein ACLFV8_06035 [Alphaproteobacteria bacterium]
MQNRLVLSILAAALIAAPAGAEQERPSLPEIPVTAMKTVAPETYEAAAELAAGGGTPVEIALEIAGPFEGRSQHIIQENEGGEAATASSVTVLRDGLLDDAVRAQRWEVALERAEAGGWTVRTVKKARLCWRGAHTEEFGTELCP